MTLTFDDSGDVLLPIGLIKALITLLSTLEGFDDHLGILSDIETKGTATSTLIGSVSVEYVHEALEDLYEYERKVYDRLARKFPVVEEVRALEIEGRY